MVNVPLPAGAGAKRIPRGGARGVAARRWTDFAPQLVFFSAGFDAHVEDDMAMLRLTDADYAWVSAAGEGGGRAPCRRAHGSVLEGGYALSALGRSAVQHLRVLAGLS